MASTVQPVDSDPLAPAAPAIEPAAEPTPEDAHSVRETLESLVMAFLLAFLFRAFCAGAFVIPTGSMAPTLMGRHKDVTCPACGCPYQVNAAGEVDARTGVRRASSVRGGTCPNCRFALDMPDDDHNRPQFKSYNGDRILAEKYAYGSGEPKRWDVTVFKFPEDATENYIKRLVGLPGEMVRIENGDVFVGPAKTADALPITSAAEQALVIARKSPEKILAMLQLVHDNDHQPTRLIEAGWPRSWRAQLEPSARSSETGWTMSGDGASFAYQANTPEQSWLRYQHLVPRQADWDDLALESPARRSSFEAQPQLVTDFYAYNTYRYQTGTPRMRAESEGLHWVGDLALGCELETLEPRGTLTLELVEGGARCAATSISPRATPNSAIPGANNFSPLAKTALNTPGKHAILWANIDDELLLWIDRKPVEFDRSTQYARLDNDHPQPADLSPAGIAAKGCNIRLRHLRVLRDVYYIADQRSATVTDYRYGGGVTEMSADAFAGVLAHPDEWSLLANRGRREFELGPDEFLMLGDNSPQSSDGRMWPGGSAVRRELLIGKALLVYWPHPWETTPSWRIPPGEFDFPFWPNFGRMGAIR